MTSKTTVVNANSDAYDVFIGRGSPWGNPFRIGVDGTRTEVLNKYESYLRRENQLLEQLSGLKGKRLGCPGNCKPHKRCHGDVLVKLLTEREFRDIITY